MPCLYIEHHGVAHETPRSFHTCLHNPAACGLRVLRQAGEMNGTSTIWSSLHLATENGFWFLSQLLTSLGPFLEDLRKAGAEKNTSESSMSSKEDFFCTKMICHFIFNHTYFKWILPVQYPSSSTAFVAQCWLSQNLISICLSFSKKNSRVQ